MRCRSSKARGGFTIVELLVAAAVSLLLMVIITEAFKRGIDMFRTMRAQGVMQDRLRQAGTALRDDLASQHFDNVPNNPVVVQNYLSFLTGDPNWEPPPDGYVRFYQGAMQVDANGNPIPFICEGYDSDAMMSALATTHILSMTVKRKGTSPDNMFRAFAAQRLIGTFTFPNDYVDPPDYRAPNLLSSQWAEVSYFLSPYQNSTTTSFGTTKLFNLHRRVRLLLPAANPPAIPDGTVTAALTEEKQSISTRTDVGTGIEYYNRITDVTEPRYRFGLLPAQTDPNDVRSAGLLIDPTNDPTVTAPHIFPNALDPQAICHAYPILGESVPWGAGANSTLAGDDIILADVISFEIKVAYRPTPPTGGEPNDATNTETTWRNTDSDGVSLSYTLPGFAAPVVNSDYPYDYLPLSQRNNTLRSKGVRVFDTWSSADQYTNWHSTGSAVSIPLRIQPKSVLIRLRIWDQKAEQTRQLTIIQDM